MYSSSINSFSNPYLQGGFSLNFSASVGAGASAAPLSAGGQAPFYGQMLRQAMMGLQAGWSGFAGAPMPMTMPGQSFGGYGMNMANRFGMQQGFGGYGSHAMSPFDPNCPPGFGWGQGGLQGQVNLEFGFKQVPGESRKMWDVWFDSKDGQKTVQRSPIVLDLNQNGKADITGKNILGDGKIDGPTTMFDLDPDNISYEFKSQQRRPGSGAPSVSGGYWVDADGKKIKGSVPKGTQKKYAGYQYLDKNGKLVGEMKDDGLYHFGKQEKREQTEWLKKNGGDGFLVADFNGDGEINSATELFGTEGTNGEKYRNGYEKLAAMFDKNKDGQVSGAEMAGLQVWADANADGKVQEGELQSLKEHNITSFNVGNYNGETMEGSYTVGGGVAPYFNLSANVFGGYGYGYSQPGYSPFGGNPYGASPYGGSSFGTTSYASGY